MVTPLETMDRAELAGVVRQVLNDENLKLRSWSTDAIFYDATNPVSGGVYRIKGQVDSPDRSWSVVVKVVRAPRKAETEPGYWATTFEPSDAMQSPPMYWRREVLAYQSGVLANLPRGLAAPRCFAISEKPPDLYWLWLEDIQDTGAHWTLFRYREAGLHLGEFNGAYLAGRPLPTTAWSASGWMRAWLWHLDQEGGIERITARVSAHALLRHALPPSIAERLRRLWKARETLLTVLDRLPHVFCHRDAVPANLLTRRGPDGRDELVAIDWAFAGIGPIGEDLAPLVIVRPSLQTRAMDLLQVERPVFDGYFQGLREAGWSGDRRFARLGFLASVALRYGCLSVGVILLQALDPVTRASSESRLAQPVDEILRREMRTVAYALSCGEEAARLIRLLFP